MNKIKTFKTKTTNSENGIFNKLSKRYSHIKFIRNSPVRNASPQPASTGSYDMTGRESDDLKREIGAPILISKTAIDMDTTDCCPQTDELRIRKSDQIESQQNFRPTSIPDLGEIKFSFLPEADQNEDFNSKRLSDNAYDMPKSNGSTVLNKNRSKSASNLHKSEIKVFLQRAPSLELENTQNGHTECRYDQPRRLQDYKKREHIADSNLSCHKSSQAVNNVTSENKIVNRTNDNPTDKVYDPQRNENYCSRDSFGANSSGSEDFDMKSASFQSLDARNLFLSIEELNEITREINESEDFNHEIDLEYCEHRDKLKPDQRRITLLRNKNNRMINLDRKKEKLSHAWSGLKNWIGEERVKIKDVVQKHASMQRVGAQANSPDRSEQTSGASMYGKINKSSPSKMSIQNESVISQSTIQSLNHKPSFEDDRLSDISGVNELEERTVTRRVCDSQPGSMSRSQSRTAESMEKDSVPKFIQSIVRKGSNRTTNEMTEGQNGFEELRRYVKQGGDFGKELVTILQERVDAEQLYAKSLSKMASKLNKACREVPGTVADSWRGVASEMESRSEVHRQFSNSMIEEIVKPLKAILDNQHKTRKAIESSVDKSARVLSEWRTSEAKAKKSSHAAARENEKLQDAMLDVRIQRSPSIALLHHNHKSPDKEIKNAEKDCAKLDNKRRKAEELVKRADVEYYTLCVRAERARVEWEMSVLRGSSILQNHENQRLTSLKNYVADYLKFSDQMNPSINQLVDRLRPYVNGCNIQKDLTVVKNIRRASEGPSEQLLPDFYCEHTTLAMNRERRKHALVKLLQLVRTDLERERKSRNGLKGISQSLSSTENQNITDKLYHIRSMLTYLEGARFKLQSALLELDHKPRGAHPLAPHIQITRDRTGLQQSILKVPLWLKNGEGDDEMNQDLNYPNMDIGDSTPYVNTNEHCVDSKNDTLIKHFDRNMSRSKSSMDFENKKKEIIVLSGTANGTMGKGTVSTKSESPTFDRGIADGGSNQPDSDFDEFSSQDEDEDLGKKQVAPRPPVPQETQQPIVISRCRALYSYYPKLYDELELNPGDLIDVHTKQEDGWWMGAIQNKIGIFPATYVEEIL